MVERRAPVREVGDFKTYLRRVVSLSKTLYSPKVLDMPRKCLLRPDMTEKLLTGNLKETATLLMSIFNQKELIKP